MFQGTINILSSNAFASSLSHIHSTMVLWMALQIQNLESMSHFRKLLQGMKMMLQSLFHNLVHSLIS